MTLKPAHFFIALIALGLFVAIVVATHQVLTEPFPGHNDFLSRWEGVRAFWVDGQNPYGPEASLRIQEMIYGRVVVEGEDPGYFAYPFYTVFLMAPLVLVDYAWASAFWMVFLEACLIISLFLLLDHFRWRPRPLLLLFLILFVLLNYFSARGLLLGQPGLLVYLLELVAIVMLARRSDYIAGTALALSTIKPQMGYLIVPFLLLWGLVERRWRFVGSFSLVFAVLMGLSFVFLPTWFSDWLGQISLYPGYTEIGSPVWVLANIPWLTINQETEKWIVDGGLGTLIEPVLIILLSIWMLREWFLVLVRRQQQRLMWTIALTLTITHLIAPRTASPHFAVFIIPLIFYLRALAYGRRRGWILITLILLILLILPWLHFLLTVAGEFEHPTIYLPVPFLVLALLWFTRKLWFSDVTDRFCSLNTGIS